MAIKAIPIRFHGEGIMDQSYYHLQGLHCPLRLIHDPKPSILEFLLARLTLGHGARSLLRQRRLAGMSATS